METHVVSKVINTKIRIGVTTEKYRREYREGLKNESEAKLARC